MNIQLSTLFCICIAFAIPLLVFSTSRQQSKESIIEDFDNNELDRFIKSNPRHQQQFHTGLYNQHYHLKKAADFEQILKPCNQMPASSGGGRDYAACVRNRMLLMGKRKRRDAN